jgi:hypothetical protein
MYNPVHTISNDLVSAIERTDYEEYEGRARGRQSWRGSGAKKASFPTQKEAHTGHALDTCK